MLNLNHTKVTDAGLDHLKALSSLKVLFLVDTEVTDAGLEHLEGLARLERLYLGDTEVTVVAVQRLQELPKTPRSSHRQPRRGFPIDYWAPIVDYSAGSAA